MVVTLLASISTLLLLLLICEQLKALVRAIRANNTTHWIKFWVVRCIYTRIPAARHSFVLCLHPTAYYGSRYCYRCLSSLARREKGPVGRRRKENMRKSHLVNPHTFDGFNYRAIGFANRYSWRDKRKKEAAKEKLLIFFVFGFRTKSDCSGKKPIERTG